jgi:hypothetical protein
MTTRPPPLRHAALAGVAGLALALVAAGGACAKDLPAASFIDKLRVLAVRAEPPEVAPGQVTALDLLAVEPRVRSLDGGAPAPLSAVWVACPLPSGSATVQPCGVGSGAPAPTVIAVNQPGEPLAASFRPDANLLGGTASTELLISVAVADSDAGAAACLGDLLDHDGVPQDPDHCVLSLKRLVVSDPLQRMIAPNANPSFADFYAVAPSGFVEPLDSGGGIWLYAPGKDLAEWDVIAHRSDDAAEQKADGSYEALSASWFATAGHLDGGRSIYLPPGCSTLTTCPDQLPETGADTSWFAPTGAEAAEAVAANGIVDFWAVLRDDRGGVSWRAGHLTLAP